MVVSKIRGRNIDPSTAGSLLQGLLNSNLGHPQMATILGLLVQDMNDNSCSHTENDVIRKIT